MVVGLAVLFPASLMSLGKEGGVLEMMSLACWAGALLFTAWTFLRKREAPERLASSWMGLIALLAFLRELDLHVALNPEVLGRFGVRYRIDWWLDGSVSLWLKLGWLAVFFPLVLALVYPPWALRGRILRLTQEGDAVVGFLFLAFGMSFLGFVFDDLLRKVVSIGIRQVAEESAEAFGAAAFLASAILRSSRLVAAARKGAQEADSLRHPC
jgi:hypothetical protein